MVSLLHGPKDPAKLNGLCRTPNLDPIRSMKAQFSNLPVTSSISSPSPANLHSKFILPAKSPRSRQDYWLCIESLSDSGFCSLKLGWY
ncbi:hypothetical protein KY284_032131 [Solanum tuberosum]|nr:hypothetical protein KY284_032131 [Solanum tuberosum]